jgi:hypothetical protein
MRTRSSSPLSSPSNHETTTCTAGNTALSSRKRLPWWIQAVMKLWRVIWPHSHSRGSDPPEQGNANKFLSKRDLWKISSASILVLFIILWCRDAGYWRMLTSRKSQSKECESRKLIWYIECELLCCNALFSGRSPPTSWRNVSPPSSGYKNKLLKKRARSRQQGKQSCCLPSVTCLAYSSAL